MRRTLACLLVALASSGIALAGAVEVGLGTVNGHDSDGNGQSYAAAWRQPIGYGPLQGRIRLESVTDLGDGVDAYNADLDLLYASRIYGRAQYYGGAGLGAAFTEAADVKQTLSLEVGAGSHYTTATATATTEQDQNYLRWSAVAGALILFNDARDIGMGLEVRYSNPFTADAENTTEAAAFLTFPLGK